MEKVKVSIELLQKFSNLIGDIDFDKHDPAKIAILVEKAHDLLIEMLGDNESSVYANDDEGEALEVTCVH